MVSTLVALVLVACAAAAWRRFQAAPSSLAHFAGLAAGCATATIIAGLQAFVFETEACVDAGGVIQSSGYCERSETELYVAQLARPVFSHPGLFVLWGAFLANVFVPAWFVYHLVLALARRLSPTSARAV